MCQYITINNASVPLDPRDLNLPPLRVSTVKLLKMPPVFKPVVKVPSLHGLRLINLASEAFRWGLWQEEIFRLLVPYSVKPEAVLRVNLRSLFLIQVHFYLVNCIVLLSTVQPAL